MQQRCGCAQILGTAVFVEKISSSPCVTIHYYSLLFIIIPDYKATEFSGLLCRDTTPARPSTYVANRPGSIFQTHHRYTRGALVPLCTTSAGLSVDVYYLIHRHIFIIYGVRTCYHAYHTCVCLLFTCQLDLDTDTALVGCPWGFSFGLLQ